MYSTFSVSTKEGDEYRISLLPAPIENLSEEINNLLSDRHIELIEIIIDRIGGNNITSQKVLHYISNKIADLFAENPNIILYYICDDCNPIPARNGNSKNKDFTVQEYRSILFTHLFQTYINSHSVTGIFDNPIIIKGEGYAYYMHLIARKSEIAIVRKITNDIKEGFGK